MEVTQENNMVYWIYRPGIHNNIWTDGYVGVTGDLKNRLNQHYRELKYNRRHPLYNSWRIHDDYHIKIIHCGLDIDEANTWEFIYRSVPDIGKNLKQGGGCRGRAAVETKNKMSESHLKRLEDPAEKEKHSSAIKKYWDNNPEAKEKYRQSGLKKYKDPAEIEKSRQAQLKRFENPKARKAVSENSKDRRLHTCGCGKRNYLKPYETDCRQCGKNLKDDLPNPI